MNIGDFLNNFFDKVYLINLDNRPDRLSTSKELLDKHNIKFERMSGIYLKNKYKDKLNIHSKTSGLGALGCALSHFKCFKDCWDNKYKNIFVFEDDITFIKKSLQIINFNILYNDLSNIDYELFYLGGSYNSKLIKIKNYLYYPSGDLYATQSIGYNISFIKKLIEKINLNIDFYIKDDLYTKLLPIDLMVTRSCLKTKIIATNPIVCVQNKSKSDIVSSHYNIIDNHDHQINMYNLNK